MRSARRGAADLAAVHAAVHSALTAEV